MKTKTQKVKLHIPELMLKILISGWNGPEDEIKQLEFLELDVTEDELYDEDVFKDIIADKLSELTGYCVNGFSYTFI